MAPELIGPDGVLTGLTRQVLEAGLEAEMSEHLGYDKHASERRKGGKSRNGTRTKTVITDIVRSSCRSLATVTAASTRSWSANASGG